ncbi:hypothetical protein FGRMN_9018 [Fusarium graminum]|nr:hypothetical protein FGRMN_9018 [Fusarium graminum]
MEPVSFISDEYGLLHPASIDIEEENVLNPTSPLEVAETGTGPVEENNSDSNTVDCITVIKISTSSSTGQHRYLGVDLFNRAIYEEDSFISNPAPNVIVQSMLGPILKQYRFLDFKDGMVVAMTETGHVKQRLQVLDQSNLYARLVNAMKLSHSSVRVLVLVYNGDELVVDIKIVPTRDAGPRDAWIDTSRHSAIADQDEAPLSNLLGQVKEAGASATAHLDLALENLLSAAARGHVQELDRLLQTNVLITDHDRLGYTALHEAVCFGHYDAVEYLVRHGADVNAILKHGGDTTLHLVVERGKKHRSFLAGSRKGPPPRLNERHVRILDLLLQAKVNIRTRSSHNHFTASELISKQLSLPREYQAKERCYLQRMLILLTRASAVMIEFRNSNRQHARSFPSAVDFIYHKPGGLMDEIMTTRKSIENNIAKDQWCWIHLPANSREWVEESMEYLSNARVMNMTEHYSKLDCIPSAFHTPRTLDQSHNMSLRASEDQDEDQVVVKYFGRHATDELGSDSRHDGEGTQRIASARAQRLLMVKQMWIWKLDDASLITAFPPRRHPKDHELLCQALETMEETPPLTLHATISSMLRCLVRFMDEPINCGLHGSPFHIFEQTIAEISNNEAKNYRAFYNLQEELARRLSRSRPDDSSLDRQEREAIKSVEDRICSITSESGDLLQIKDVRGELRMIHSILEGQYSAIKAYTDQRRLSGGKHGAKTGNRKESGDTVPQEEEILEEEVTELETTLGTVNQQIARVKTLSANASSVEESLKNLLDLKQKQGSLMAVRDTRALANDADARAKQGERQSQLLFIFTIVTVFFTPVSFASAFMAVPTREFPHDGEGEVSWAWWQVFVAGLVVELFTLTCVSPWLFSEVKRWKEQKDRKDWLDYFMRHRGKGNSSKA